MTTETTRICCDCSLHARKNTGKKRLLAKKTLAMYCTMVVVSTVAIFLLEHATVLSAFRTALVAAIGKTIAASWVTTLFEP